MQRRSDASCWGTVFQRKPRHRSLRVLRTGMPAVLSPHRSYWAHRTSKGGNTTMLTRRVFLRGSAIVLAGMGVAPGWLARASQPGATPIPRSEEHTSELQSRLHLVCRLLLEKKKKRHKPHTSATA